MARQASGTAGDKDHGPTPLNQPKRQFTATYADPGTIRIANNTTKHTIAALTQREANQLSRELRSVLKKNRPTL